MSAERRRARVLLAVGALLGVGLAVRWLRSPSLRPSDDDALRAFYAAHLDRFARPGRVCVEALFFAGPGAAAVARAEAARQLLLAGRDPAMLADPAPGPVPVGLVSPVRIAATLGGPVALAVEGQPPGGTTPAVPVDGGVWVVRVLEREPARLPTFDEARDEVRVQQVLAGSEGGR